MVMNWIGDLATWCSAIATVVIVWLAVWPRDPRKPLLIIGFDPKSEVKTQTRTHHPDYDLPPGVRSIWIRVRITSRAGRRTAKGCRAYLTRMVQIGYFDTDEKVCMHPEIVHLDHDSRQLQWMHDEDRTFLAKDIVPGIDHWLDLVSSWESLSTGLPGIQCYPPMLFPVPGIYKLTIRVGADDADPVEAVVGVVYKGTWDAIEVKWIK